MAATNTLSNSVAEALKLKIIAREYVDGEKLPNEQVLSEHFSVSRPTIREAIKILASKNIVTIQRGRGTYVNKNPGMMDDPLGLEFVQQDVAIHDMCEMRFFVEPIASYLAAQRATKGQLETTEGLIEEMRQLALSAAENGTSEDITNKFRNCESYFHSMIYEMTNNTIFKRLQPSVIELIHSFYYEHYTHKDYKYQATYENHNRMFQAIKIRDKDLAFKCAKQHLLDMPPFLIGQHFVLTEGIDLQIVAIPPNEPKDEQPDKAE